jgi:hypothetical protein
MSSVTGPLVSAALAMGAAVKAAAASTTHVDIGRQLRYFIFYPPS